jgi:uridine kinase
VDVLSNKIMSSEVQIILQDGEIVTGIRGAPVVDFIKNIPTKNDVQIVGAIVNNELRELIYPIVMESHVTPVTMSDADGMRIYRRSLILILEAGFKALHPDMDITIDHSVSFGGYFCKVYGESQLSEEEIKEIQEKMEEMVAADIPITRKEVPLDEVMKKFEANHQYDKIRLLKHRKKDYLMLYFLGDHADYHHGYMVPSTGYIKWFNLRNADQGFILQFPRTSKPSEIGELHDYPKLLSTFQKYGNWLETLKIDSVGALNDAIEENRIREVIMVSEALHDQQLANMAGEIASRKNEIKVVSIAGPSSSGKTTTSRRLTIQLLAHGIQPFPLEMDRYFVDRTSTPLDEDGNFDFEHLDALDRDRLNSDLVGLINGEEVQLPHYNFKTGVQELGKKVKLKSNQLIIIEGIHGLNPNLVTALPANQIFRVYIAALTQLNLDRHNRVSTTDTRLIRRIVRDARTRGYTPKETISRWESVKRGEKKNIYPYQENADIMFNSALVYELAALKPIAEPLLRQVPYGSDEHIEVKRLLALLEWFLPIDGSWIPDNSLLKEFLGDSIFEDFKLWKSE